MVDNCKHVVFIPSFPFQSELFLLQHIFPIFISITHPFFPHFCRLTFVIEILSFSYNGFVSNEFCSIQAVHTFVPAAISYVFPVLRLVQACYAVL